MAETIGNMAKTKDEQAKAATVSVKKFTHVKFNHDYDGYDAKFDTILAAKERTKQKRINAKQEGKVKQDMAFREKVSHDMN